MEWIIIYIALYFLTLLIYYKKRKSIDCGFVLLAIYAIIGICGFFLYRSDPRAWHLSLWPFIYLFIVTLLFMRPYLIDYNISKRIHVQNSKTLNIFAFLYIICALIAMVYDIPRARDNMTLNDWSSVYQEDNVILYTNFVERLAKNFVGYLKIPAVIALFYYLILRKNIFIIVLLGICIIAPSFLTAMIVGGRGLLFSVIVLLIIAYILFKAQLPPFAKKLFISIGAGFGIMALIYALSVTLSRFGEDMAQDSILYYFGHSPLAFNYGVVDTIDSYFYGSYTFNWIIERLSGVGIDAVTIDTLLGTHYGSSFITFIGTLYIDFGFIGTIIIAILFPLFVAKTFKGRHPLSVASLFIYLFYLNYLVMGVFVVGLGSDISWYMAAIIYLILKKMI